MVPLLTVVQEMRKLAAKLRAAGDTEDADKCDKSADAMEMCYTPMSSKKPEVSGKLYAVIRKSHFPDSPWIEATSRWVVDTINPKGHWVPNGTISHYREMHVPFTADECVAAAHQG